VWALLGIVTAPAVIALVATALSAISYEVLARGFRTPVGTESVISLLRWRAVLPAAALCVDARLPCSLCDWGAPGATARVLPHEGCRTKPWVMTAALPVMLRQRRIVPVQPGGGRQGHSGRGVAPHQPQRADIPKPDGHHRGAGANSGGDRLPRLPAHLAHQVRMKNKLNCSLRRATCVVGPCRLSPAPIAHQADLP